MANHLKMADKQRIQALLELGWSYHRVQWESGVRRETQRDPKAAKVPTGSASVCDPYRNIIEAAIEQHPATVVMRQLVGYKSRSLRALSRAMFRLVRGPITTRVEAYQGYRDLAVASGEVPGVALLPPCSGCCQ